MIKDLASPAQRLRSPRKEETEEPEERRKRYAPSATVTTMIVSNRIYIVTLASKNMVRFNLACHGSLNRLAVAVLLTLHPFFLLLLTVPPPLLLSCIPTPP